jgi:hypothetical protein
MFLVQTKSADAQVPNIAQLPPAGISLPARIIWLKRVLFTPKTGWPLF